MRSFVYLLGLVGAVAFFLAIVGIAGSIDYAEAQRQEMLYCEMI